MAFESIACIILTIYYALVLELWIDKKKHPRQYKSYTLLCALSFLLFVISLYIY